MVSNRNKKRDKRGAEDDREPDEAQGEQQAEDQHGEPVLALLTREQINDMLLPDINAALDARGLDSTKGNRDAKRKRLRAHEEWRANQQASVAQGTKSGKKRSTTKEKWKAKSEKLVPLDETAISKMTILALKQALDLRKVKFRAKDPKADLAAKLLATEEERLKKATQGASKDHAAEDGSAPKRPRLASPSGSSEMHSRTSASTSTTRATSLAGSMAPTNTEGSSTRAGRHKFKYIGDYKVKEAIQKFKHIPGIRSNSPAIDVEMKTLGKICSLLGINSHNMALDERGEACHQGWAQRVGQEAERERQLEDSIRERILTTTAILENRLQRPANFFPGRLAFNIADPEFIALHNQTNTMPGPLTDSEFYHALADRIEVLGRINVEGVGNCLFGAIARATLGIEELHPEVRTLMADVLERAARLHQPWMHAAGIGTDYPDGESYYDYLVKYAQRMRTPRFWGGVTDLAIAARVFNINVVARTIIGGHADFMRFPATQLDDERNTVGEALLEDRPTAVLEIFAERQHFQVITEIRYNGQVEGTEDYRTEVNHPNPEVPEVLPATPAQEEGRRSTRTSAKVTSNYLPPECIEWTVAKLAVEAEKLQMKVTRLKEEKRAKEREKQRKARRFKAMKQLNKVTPRCHGTNALRGCAAISANHERPYYSSGGFTKNCPHCTAKLLESEYEQATRKFNRKKTLCCSDGKVHTDRMIALYRSFMKPIPSVKEYSMDLTTMTTVDAKAFLDFVRLINYRFAMAAAETFSEEKLKEAAENLERSAEANAKKVYTEKPGSIIKINGEVRFIAGDLKFKADNPRKIFAYEKLWTMGREEAVEKRADQFLGREMAQRLDDDLSAHNELCRMFRSIGEKIDELESKGTDTTHVKLTILTNAQAVQDKADDRTIHTHRSADAVDGKAVAVLWQDDGSGRPPKDIKGIHVTARGGLVYYLPYMHPLIPALTFPMIHTKGERGYSYGIAHRLPGNERAEEEPDEVLHIDHPEDADVLPDDQELLEREFDDLPDEDPLAAENDEPEEEPTNEDLEELLEEVRRESNKRKNVSIAEFHRYMYGYRVNPDIGEDESVGLKQPHFIFGKRSLGQLYAIINTIQKERKQMEWATKDRGEDQRTMLSQELIEALEKRLDKEKEEVLGKVIFCPPTFKGSQRHMQKVYADATRLFEIFGLPHLFITFTMSGKCEEIASQLRPGENYWDRPELVTRIWKDKFDELCKDLFKRQIFGKVACFVLSVEHQQRGLPHAHILLTLDESIGANTASWVNDYISAQLPPLPDKDDHSEKAQQMRRLRKLVIELMLHDCYGKQGKAGCRADPRYRNSYQCEKHFPKPYSLRTILETSGFPIYTRLSEEQGGEIWTRPSDGRKFANDVVVPYNPYLLLKYGSHVNVEYVGSQKVLDYVLKYVLKGHDVAYIRMKNGREVKPDDSGKKVIDWNEVQANFTTRIMGAVEAVCRIYGVPTTKLSHSVLTLYVHGEKDGPHITFTEGEEESARGRAEASLRAGRRSMLTAYFERCADPDEEREWRDIPRFKQGPAAKDLLYEEFPEHYVWHAMSKSWRRRMSQNRKKPQLIRVGTVSPGNAELCAIRLLLMATRGVASFEALRTIPGEDYPRETFTEAAQERGLLESMGMWIRLFKEASREMRSTYRFRRFFVLTLYTSQPPNPMELLEHFIDRLAPKTGEMEWEDRIERALQHLEFMTRRLLNKSCKDIGLQTPKNYDQEDMDRRFEECMNPASQDYDPEQREQIFVWEELAQDSLKNLNKGQRDIFDEVMKALEEKRQLLLFISGDGGTGKTFLYNTIIQALEAAKRNNIAAATTGIAAVVLLGGRTAHSAYKIPLNARPDMKPRLYAHSELGEAIKKADVLIIDEISMMHCHVLDYIDRQVRDLMGKDKRHLPFGGKIVLMSGDFKQLMPVVKSGRRADEIAASVKNLEVFNLFERRILTENMRTEKGEVEFREFLHQVGNGLNFERDAKGRKTDFIKLPEEMLVDDMQELIDFCFPRDVLADPMSYSKTITGSAILTPTNDNVDLINERVLKQLSGESTIYHSIDRILQDKDPMRSLTSLAANSRLEFVHTLRPGNLPPHKLELKVGAIVMLLRNISLSEGLCNGTRLQVTKMMPEMIECLILTGPMAGKKTHLWRVRFDHGKNEGDRGVMLERLQFPIRLCFAMTINKSQAQTLDRMGLALNTQQVFAHGQIYTAFSRVRKAAGIKVLSVPNEDFPSADCIVNIVNIEILDKLPERAADRAEPEVPPEDEQEAEPQPEDEEYGPLYDEFDPEDDEPQDESMQDEPEVPIELQSDEEPEFDPDADEAEQQESAQEEPAFEPYTDEFGTYHFGPGEEDYWI